jgi:hypothetical protein
MAALLDGDGIDRAGGALRRARVRAVGLGGRRLRSGGADRRSEGGHRRRRARPVRVDGDGPGRPGGDRIRGPLSGAGQQAGVLRQLRRCAAQPDGRRGRAGRHPRADRAGRLGSGGPPVPAGVHHADDPRRDRGTDALGGRPAADGGLGVGRRRLAARAHARGRHPAAAPTRGAHARAARPWRQDERVREGSAAGHLDRRSAAGHAGQREPHPARGRTGLAGLPAGGGGLPGRRPAGPPPCPAFCRRGSWRSCAALPTGSTTTPSPGS